jgi:Mn-dependent DtxR family transcriptional regulator
MPTENMLLAHLPGEERERLRPYLEPVPMEMAEVLIWEERKMDYCWFPNDCVTSTLQLLRNGDAIEAGLMGLEGFVGIQLWLHVPSTASRTLVQVPGSGYRMRAQDFVEQVVRKPESPLNELLAKYVHGFLVLTSQTAACNRVHSIDERLCRWLRMVYNRVPERREMPLRQDFLAQMLGVRRPTVSTAASILQKAGYIEYSRGRLTILNPDGLAEGACECYELMEAQFDRIFTQPWRHLEPQSNGRETQVIRR